jgi:ATP/ADP translocase
MALALFMQALNIRKNEGFKVFIIALLGFFWSLANSIGVRYADAYFLLHVGSDKLPLVYMVTACAMIVPSLLLLKLASRFSAKQIYLLILGFVAFFYISLLLLILTTDIEFSPWMWFFYRVLAYQMEAILMTGYWTFSDRFFNMQDAKRLFVLFSSTVFLGNATTGLMMSSGQFNFITLILIILFLIACAIGLTEFVDRRFHVLHEEETEEHEEEQSSWNPLHLLNGIKKSPLALLIMLSSFLIFLMWVTAEYNYFTYFVNFFGTEEQVYVPLQEQKAPLTLFLGKIITLVSFTNLLFGFLLYSRLIRSFGLTTLLFISPVIMICAFTGWLIYPALLFPVMAYFVVEGALDVVDDCNFNLLLNAIPKRLKYKVRVVIESIIEPLGMLLAGLLLRFFNPAGPFLTLIISIGVFCVAYTIKNNYHKAIYESLAANSIAFHRTLKGWIETLLHRKEDWLLLLNNLSAEGNKRKKRQILRLLFSFPSHRVEEIVEACRTLPVEEKKLLFEEAAIYRVSHDPYLSDFAKECLGKEDKTLWAWSAYFLAANANLKKKEVQQLLQSEDFFMQAVGFVAILNNPIYSHTENQIDEAKEKIRQFLQSRNKAQELAALRALRITQISEAATLALPFLYHADSQIAIEAAKTLYSTFSYHDREVMKSLIRYICHSKNIECRRWVIRTIAKMSDPAYLRKVILLAGKLHRSEHRLIEQMVKQMGKQGNLVLLSLSKNPKHPLVARALAAKILGHTSLHLLHANLEEIVIVEMKNATILTKLLFQLKPGNSAQEKLFEKALLSSLEHYVEFIIQILSYAGELEDPELVLRLWREKSPRVQSQLIETLEMTCERKIFRSLQPLLEFSALYASREPIGSPFPPIPKELEKQMRESSLLSEQLAIAIYYYAQNDLRWEQILPSILGLTPKESAI